MKTFLQISFFFLLIAQICLAQQNFWQLKGSPYGKEILCIKSRGPEKVFLSVSDGLLFKSTDSGQSWSRTNYSHSLVQVISLDNSGTIYVGTSNDGVLRTTDDGNTWQQISTGLTDLNIISLAVTSTGNIFCGTADGGVFRLDINEYWVYLGLANVAILSLEVDLNGNIYAGTSGYSIYKSINDGNEWAQIYSGLGDDRFVHSLAINSEGKIFAGTDLGIYRSENEGQSWIQINNGLQDTVARSILISSDLIFSRVGVRMYKSTNAGDNWLPIDNLEAEPLCIGKSESGFILTGTILGVFRSTDDGTTWLKHNDGLTNAEPINAMTFNSTGSFYSALSSGLFCSVNDGINWKQTCIRNENIQTLISTPLNGYLFAGTEYGIIRSTDGGLTWSEKSGYWHANKITLKSDALGMIYAGYKSPGYWGGENGAVIKSSDEGETWLETGLNGPAVNAMDLNLSGYILAARGDSGIYLSTDQGEDWISKGLNDNTISSVLLTNSGCMFAGTEGGALYRSCDDGMNWINIALTEMTSINCMLKTVEGYIFVGDSTGIFRSTDNGDTWDKLNSGLTDINIQSLLIGHSGHLYLGSSKGIIFKSSETVTTDLEFENNTPQTFHLYQNFPNPFNPSTSIRFSVPQRTHIQLKVFDIIGCEIVTLVNEELEAGNYDITFSAGGISTGVYIYQLKAGTYLESKKMMLIR